MRGSSPTAGRSAATAGTPRLIRRPSVRDGVTDDQSRRRFLSRRAIALAGVMALAGCTSGGNGNGGGDDGPTPSDEPTATATDSGGSNADHTVVVGPAGSLVFDPAELAVAPGDTVEF
mgnify:CR=1 FL=1